MKKLLIILLIVICLPCEGKSQPSVDGMFLLRIVCENEKPILFTPSKKNKIKVYYKHEQQTKTYSDTNRSRKSYGYIGFSSGLIKKIVISYNHQKMTIKLMENCPLALDGGWIVIDTLYFKKGEYLLDCSKTPNKTESSNTFPQAIDITPYYWWRKE